MLHMRHLKLPLYNDITFLPCAFDVTLPDLEMVGNVRAGFGINEIDDAVRSEVGVQERGVGIHATQRIHDRLQDFIVDLNQPAGFLSNSIGCGNYTYDRITDKAHAVAAEDVSIFKI